MRRVSRRRSRPRTLSKAIGNSPAVRGTTWTADQVAAVLRATVASAGGQAAAPLPRLEPMVPFGPGIPLTPSPINPLQPGTQRAEPRAYEYPVAYNLPGFGDRLVPWKVLRDAADMIPLFRRCIEIRKAEVATLDWDVTISAKAVERAQRQDPGTARSDVEKAMRERVDPHIGRLVDFWEQPDPRNGHDFIAWASKLLEEYFVLDAISIYPRLRRNGDMYGFEILDGTTIKPLLDVDGFRPLPPQPAFQQILYGFPRGEFVADGAPDPDSGRLPGAYPADRLVYKVHNVRSWTPYGFSAVEQALYDGELYIRRMGWLKAEYTDGVMPSGWLLAGEGQAEWSPQMLREYGTAFNDYLAGASQARQRFQILPFGMKPQEAPDLNERYRPDYDLHLIKLVASHFDTTIAELGFTETHGLGSTGWHEGQADVQDRKATQPTLRRLQALCTAMMRTFLGAPPELEFRILGLESEDEEAADEVANRRIGSARMTLNEDRDRTGLPRYNFDEADMPMLVTQRGIVFIEGASKQAPAGTMVGPAQAIPEGGQTTPGQLPSDGDAGGAEGAGPASPSDNAPAKKSGPQEVKAAKAELRAYHSWVSKRDRSRAEPFQFTYLTKAQAAHAGVDLSLAEFVNKADEGVAGRAPKVRHWPGWERDLAVAEHWANRLLSALTGTVSATTLVSEAGAAYRRGGDREDIARAIARHDWRGAILPSLRGLWTDGYVVGTLSAQAVLAHHGVTVVKAAAPAPTMTIGVDWGGWSPGDEAAAKQILGQHDALGHLLRLVDSGDAVADSIVVTRMDRLARVLIEGLERGDAPAAIARALRPILDDPKWAARVALTETTRAVSSATLLRYARNGVEAKEWMTAADQRVCTICGTNEDQGAVPLGSAFPSGADAPPAHVLCRCSVAPAWLTPAEAAAEGVGPDLGLLPSFAGEELGAVVTREAEEIFGELEADLETATAEAPGDALAAARARQAEIDEARKVADLAAQVHELIGNEATPDVIRFRLDAYARRTGLDVSQLVALADDPAALAEAVDEMATEAGLTRVGLPGERSGLNRAQHELIGSAPRDGEVVEVVRPGYVARLGSGEEVRLSRAAVEAVGPEEPPRVMPVRVAEPPSTPTAREVPPGDGPLPNRQARSITDLLTTYGDVYRLDSFDERYAQFEQLRQEVEQALQGEYGSAGLTIKVERAVSIGDGPLSFYGQILDPEGKKVGRFSRLVRRDDRTGELHAEHVMLQLARRVQGSGFAEQFNRNLYDWYRESGLTKVEVHADIDVGGYTWARAGYDFLGPQSAQKFLDEARIKVDKALARTPKYLTRDQVRALDQYLRDLEDGKEPVSAPRIAGFGREPGQGGRGAMWAGKWLMLKSDWWGALRL